MKFSIVVLDGRESARCPFNGGDRCDLLDRSCFYGLTEVSVPEYCPLADGGVKVEVVSTRGPRYQEACENDHDQEGGGR